MKRKRNRLPIEQLENRLLLATFTVINANDSGAGSLRQAIIDANATPAVDTVAFTIPGVGVHTINLLSELPGLTNPAIIDGTTQPLATSGAPLIELNGAGAGVDADGISVGDVDATIRGLAINRFNNRGIVVAAPTNDVIIQTNYIGVDPTGLIARPNLNGGIEFTGDNGIIGGPAVGDRNIIGSNGNSTTGSADSGIVLTGTGNTIRNNFIGVGANLTTALGNANFGILITGTSTNNTILGNIIANNGTVGVLIAKTATGTDITNNGIYGNATLGIDLQATASTPLVDGRTANDDDDPDAGGNNLQNFPVITAATVLTNGTALRLQGTLNSTVSQAFRIEFFSSRQLEPVDLGEGANGIGQVTVNTSAGGDATFDVTFSGSFSTLTSFTATATNTTLDNTSEFSAPVGALYFAATGGNDVITFAAGTGNDVVLTINGTSQTLEGDGLNFLGIDALDGNDLITIGNGILGVYVLGGAGTDSLNGGSGKDTLTGGAQTDFIVGGDGDDRLNGSGGHDSLQGDIGDDRLYGGDGFDTATGGAGVDRFFGGDGNDSLIGNGSNDKLNGEGGDDELFGNDGNDILHGNDGFDHLLGGDGNDTMDGEGSADTLEGGAGNDFMGGSGGVDRFTGGPGLDTMLGGTGNDIFSAVDGEVDSLDGGSGTDSATADAGVDILVSVEG